MDHNARPHGNVTYFTVEAIMVGEFKVMHSAKNDGLLRDTLRGLFHLNSAVAVI